MVCASHRSKWTTFCLPILCSTSFCALPFQQISPPAANLLLSAGHTPVLFAVDTILNRGAIQGLQGQTLALARGRCGKQIVDLSTCLVCLSPGVLLLIRF